MANKCQFSQLSKTIQIINDLSLTGEGQVKLFFSLNNRLSICNSFEMKGEPELAIINSKVLKGVSESISALCPELELNRLLPEAQGVKSDKKIIIAHL